MLIFGLLPRSLFLFVGGFLTYLLGDLLKSPES